MSCEHYTRPAGVLGGPCLNCGASQPEHVKQPPGTSVPDFKTLVEQFTLSAHLWEAEAVLRQVWNARGAADLAAIFDEHIRRLDGNSEESDDALRDAIRKLDR